MAQRLHVLNTKRLLTLLKIVKFIRSNYNIFKPPLGIQKTVTTSNKNKSQPDMYSIMASFF